jgi:hypothetical protein
MTRGRRPVQAVEKAVKIAGRRGIVIMTAGTSPFDFLILGSRDPAGVKVVRTRRHIRKLCEVMENYGDAIDKMRRLPPAVAGQHELWVLSPWDTWQYYIIDGEKITEVSGEGVPMAGQLPA